MYKPLKSDNIADRTLELLDNFIEHEKEYIDILEKMKADNIAFEKKANTLRKERQDIKKKLEFDGLDQMMNDLGLL